jgi:serine-type D-Ala-D-Ala carboxypeptidase (penicillin-binding protein 5/6)
MTIPLFSHLVSLIFSFHSMLYRPVFPPVPQISAKDISSDTIILSQPTFSHKQAPLVLAQAAFVIDAGSSEVLFESKADTPLFPASTTKIMTALVVLESMQLDTVVTITAAPAQDGSHMGLLVGEQIQVWDLLAGLLIASANDAADVLSRNYPGGASAFIDRMNAKALELGLTRTHYTNVIGYSELGHMTSVRDLAILAREAMQHPDFSHFVGIKAHTVTSVDQTIIHTLKTTNELLGVFDGMEGIKTGWTEEAGECFVAQATRGNQTIVTALLASPDRFGETKRLLDWAFTSYRTEKKPLSEW